MTVTVLPPPLLIGGVLRSLWDSLQKQTVKDFEWLVVDDGSTDGTKNLITQLQEKSDFPIRYIYKSNGGKHTALNVGIQTICSELTFIVDSDDFLTDDAVESILKIHRKYDAQNNICGYAFLRAFPDGKVTKEELDKLSTCDFNATINDGLSKASKDALKGTTGEAIVDADIAKQMNK